MILLTSAGSGCARAQPCRRFAARLTKPVKQSDLLDAIVTASRVRRSRAGRHARGSKRRQPDHVLARPLLRMLVAEDNLTNQKLVDALLKQRGIA